MRMTRKLVGFAVAVALFTTQFTVAFATAPADMGNADNTYTATDGTANILDFSVNSVVVPTTIKVALNPKRYTVNIRYNKVASDASYAAGTYFKLNSTSGKYEKFAATSENWAANVADLYTAQNSTAQVVSLDYGIVNKSTKQKVVKAEFKVSYTEKTGAPATGTSPIEFVDTALKAGGKNDNQVTNGEAETNELKMFLQVQTADAAPKVIETYKRVTTPATEWSATETFYKVKDDGLGYETESFGSADLLAAADHDVFFITSDVTNGVAITPATTAAQLSDAKISPVTASTNGSPQTFTPGENADKDDAADTSVTYALDAGTYTDRDNQVIDWNTLQSDLGADGFVCTAVPGVTGFTIAGAMNYDCDWTMANTTAIKITPKYTIRNLKSNETTTPVTGAQKQVTINRSPSVTTASFAILEEDKDATINVDLGEGSLKATKVDKVNFIIGGTSTDFLGNNVTYADGVVTIKAFHVNYFLTSPDDEIEIVFDDDDTTPTKVKFKLAAKE